MSGDTGNASDALPRRPYGKEGVEVSVVGFGGIVVADRSQQEADRAVADAIAAGVNYFDIAPSYGNAIEQLGPALEPYRKDCFLACKTLKRDAEKAREELEQSLETMRTDHFDLFQLHALSDVERDVEAVFAGGGAMETLLDAREKGRVRYLGFSAHTEEAALAAMERFEFDSLLFPINFACLMQNDFGRRVLAAAKERGVTVLAIKTLALTRWEEGDPERANWPRCWYRPVMERRMAELALRFTLSQVVTMAMSPGEEAGLRMMLDVAAGDLSPLTPKEEAELLGAANRTTPIFPK